MSTDCSNTGLTAVKDIALAHHKSGKKREDLELRETEQVLKEDADRHGGKNHKFNENRLVLLYYTQTR